MRVIAASSIPLSSDHHFLASARKFGIPLEMTIRDIDWTGTKELPILISFLKTLDPNEIVLGTDAWDVIFCCPVDEIEGKFKDLDSPIVHGGEASLFPSESAMYGEYPDGPSSTKHINGGGWIAYAGKMLEMITHPDFWPSSAWCNQSAYHHWFITHPEFGQKIDYTSEIFLVYWSGPIQRDMGRIVMQTGIHPCLFHTPGRVNGWKAKWWWEYMRNPESIDQPCDPSYISSPTLSPSPNPLLPTSQQARRDIRWQITGGRRR